ncbi:MAG: copper chaperone Copz family protein [Elusimicrobia bacterium]|nr:copper chaperone Copz family protein [Elusimicrobiota bacterium]
MSQSIQSHEECCKITTTLCPCPVCGNMGRKVTPRTLDNHVPSPLREAIGDEATFCTNPDCNVVYCNPKKMVILRGETKFPVTIKDSGDDVYVCYCFQHKRADVRRDLKEKETTDIPDKIRKGVKEGLCDCERKNPQGACCLGNVVNTIKTIQTELKEHPF